MSQDELSVIIELDEVTVTVDDPAPIDVQTFVEPNTKVVLAGNVGPPGRDGDIGPQGPAGQDADSTFQYVHDQMIASSTWTIVHNLNGFPNVTVVDSSGQQVEGQVSYVDNNTIVVTFSASFGGKAYLT